MVERLVCQESPMQLAGGYSLDLYCKWENLAAHGWSQDGLRGEFYEQTYGQCAKTAKRQGWIIHRDGTATCPACAKLPKQVDPK